MIGLLIFRRLVLGKSECLILTNNSCDFRNFLGQSGIRFGTTTHSKYE